MGIIKKGILGGFSGKVGNVVGASWRGIDYIRSMPSSVRNPRTKKQVTQRNKFIVTMELLRPLTPVIREGFKKQGAGKITPMNAAMSYNLMNAVKGEFPDFSIDYPKVVLSRGELQGAAFVTAGITDNKLSYNWDVSTPNNAEKSDKVITVIYNVAKREAIYDMDAAVRMLGDVIITLPSHWDGDSIEAYLVFQSEDGTLISNSAYAGSYEIAED